MKNNQVWSLDFWMGLAHKKHLINAYSMHKWVNLQNSSFHSQRTFMENTVLFDTLHLVPSAPISSHEYIHLLKMWPITRKSPKCLMILAAKASQPKSTFWTWRIQELNPAAWNRQVFCLCPGWALNTSPPSLGYFPALLNTHSPHCPAHSEQPTGGFLNSRIKH